MIPTNFKPLLAATCEDVSSIHYPVYVPPKLDGIRCVIFGGVAYSRSMKPIRNTFVQSWVARNADFLEAMDGELIVGEPTAENVFQVTSSGVMSKDGEPDFGFYVFDVVSELPYHERLLFIARKLNTILPDHKDDLRLCFVESELVNNQEELMVKEKEALESGYEGIMVRSPFGKYKMGRSTVKEGILLKVKRFVDTECKIIGFKEKMHNTNEATLDNLGHTERSSAKEGLVPANTLGALIVEYDGQELGVGSGFDDATRKYIWENRDTYLGKLAKIKYFPIGIKELPRFPVYIGIRSEDDL